MCVFVAVLAAVAALMAFLFIKNEEGKKEDGWGY